MPRYIVKIWHESGAADLSLQADSEDQAKTIGADITRGKILSARLATKVDDAWYALSRAFVRSGRIVIGAGFGLGAVLLFFSGDISDVPFAQLTLGALIGGVFRVIGSFILGFIGWEIAFGAAPERDSKLIR